MDGARGALDRGRALSCCKSASATCRSRELADLTRKVLRIPNPHGTKILVNDRADVAIACQAHGVHLRDGSVSPEKFARPGFLVTVSCHRIEDAHETAGASFVLLRADFQTIVQNGSQTGAGNRRDS